MSISVALLLFASAQGGAAQAAPGAAAEDPVVCRKPKLAEVGTRFKPKPVCMKKSEWALERQTTQRGLQDMRDRSSNIEKLSGR